MRYLINSEADKLAIANRLARKAFTRPFEISVRFTDGRTSEQNRMLWALLNDVSEQVIWHGVKHAPMIWKDIFTAALKNQQFVPGLDGTMVVIGGHTSRMSKRDFNDLIELILSFGADNNVQFKEHEHG